MSILRFSCKSVWLCGRVNEQRDVTFVGVLNQDILTGCPASVCLSCRVGVCGLGGRGQHPPPLISGDLLVPVLSSLLLLLRPLLLLSRHLLLSTTPWVKSVLVAFFTPVTFQIDLLSRCSPAAQFMRRGRWQRGARLLRFLCIPTTSRVFTLWFLSLLHPIRTQRSPPSPQWRPTWLEVRADKRVSDGCSDL